MRPPNFLIVGAMKSGTTSLARLLNSHPEIFVHKKEQNFFSDNDLYFSARKEYIRKFSHIKNNVIAGEKSPIYMYDSRCIKRIKLWNKDMKLVFILRDPVYRTYSNYIHSFKMGREEISFKEAIDNEQDRIKENPFYGYAERSDYVKQIKKYLEEFELSQMHFIVFEEFIKNPEAVLKRLLPFLGKEYPPGLEKKKAHSNKSKLPLSLKLQRVLDQHLNQNDTIYSLIYQINKTLGFKKIPPIPDEMLQKLKKRFLSQKDDLLALTGLEIGDYWD